MQKNNSVQDELACKNVSERFLIESKENARAVRFNDRLMLVVAAAILDMEGNVLLTCRAEGKKYAGLWEFPGGKVEQGECSEEALSRELKEELDISVSSRDLEFFTFTQDDNLRIEMYLCKKWEREPKAMEGQEMRWIPIKDCVFLNMPPYDQILRKRFLSRFG